MSTASNRGIKRHEVLVLYPEWQECLGTGCRNLTKLKSGYCWWCDPCSIYAMWPG